MPGTTEYVASFVAQTRYEDLPQEVVALCKRQLLDTLGVSLLAGRYEVGQMAHRIARHTRGEAQATVIGAGLRTTVPAAAYANAALCRALEYDDIWVPVTHPSSVVVPPALAVGEARGISGKQLIVALAVGYEVLGRTALGASGGRGWNTTIVFGALGAAAAAAKAAEATAHQVRVALGYAGAWTGGLGAHLGTMAGYFGCGVAAQNGVMGVLLAQEGMTANPNILEAPRGFYDSLYGGVGDLWRVTSLLGRPYHLQAPGVGIKFYPSGWLLHHTFDATLRLVRRHHITAPQVEAIAISIPSPTYFLNRPLPANGVEARYSLQYHAALAVLDGRLDVESFTDRRLQAEDVQALLRRTALTVRPGLPDPVDRLVNPVTLRLPAGPEGTDEERLPLSHGRYPPEPRQGRDKFRACVAGVLSEERAARVLEVCDRLDEVADVRELTALVA